MPVIFVAGASKGIGLEISKHLNSTGNEIIGLGRNFPPEVRDFFRETVELDITFEDNIPKLYELLSKFDFKIQYLVNNIGKSGWKSLEKIDQKFVSQIFNTNVFSHINITKALLATHPIKSIVNIGSIAGRRGSANNTIYSASKFAINGITQSLAKELGPKGIRINTVSPVLISTPGLFSALNEQDSPLDKLEIVEFMNDFAEKQSALKRLPTATEVAKVVSFLLGEESSAITGQNINVDCGVFPQ